MYDFKKLPKPVRSKFDLVTKLRYLSLQIFRPPCYAAQSINDFLISRKYIEKGANLIQALRTDEFPYGKVVIFFPNVLKFGGINSDDSITLEDSIARLELLPYNKQRLELHITEQRLRPGQKVGALLLYSPEIDATWVWHLSKQKYQTPETSKELGFAYCFAGNSI